MIKTIGFDPHDFNPLPPHLYQAGTQVPLDEIDVDLDQLCHHLYLDCHGTVPVVNPTVAYLTALLSASPSFEFSGNGPGTHREIRVAESNKYGKAFCRWFLYTHLKLSYFAHVDQVLKLGFPTPFNKWTVKKKAGKGLLPDYFCAKHGGVISLGEAKGRQSLVTWSKTTGDFVEWRKQFDLLEVKDPLGSNVQLKGYISAAILKNETHKKLKSKLIVEDPNTPGDRPLTLEESDQLRLAIMAYHYAGVLEQLTYSVHAAYLRLGQIYTPQINRVAPVWNCHIPTLRDRQFVGGFVPPADLPALECYPFDMIAISWFGFPANCNLVRPRFTFFGLDKKVFENLLQTVRTGLQTLDALEEQVVPVTPEAVSFLRDGTLICSLDYMELRDEIQL